MLQRYLTALAPDALADAMFYVVIGWLATEASSPLMASVIVGASSVLRAVLMLPAGAVSDREGSVRVAYGTLAARLGVVIVLLFACADGDVSALLLITVAALFGAIDAFHMTAIEAIVGVLTPEDQVGTRSTVAMVTQAVAIIGPVLGGVLAAWSVAFAVGLMAALLCLAQIALHRFGPQLPPTPVEDESMARMVVAGLRYVWRSTMLRRILFTFVLVNCISTGPIVLMATLKTREYSWDGLTFGIAMTAFGVGALGGAFLSRYGRHASPPARLRICGVALLIGGCGGLLTMAAASNPAVLVFGAATFGVAGKFSGALLMATASELAPEQMLGRVMAIIMFGIFSMIPLGFVLFGWLADLVGTRAAGVIAAAALLPVAAMAFSGAGRPAPPAERAAHPILH